MAKIYEYVIKLFSNKKYDAVIREYELVAESETQYVYKSYGTFEILHKINWNGKSNLMKCEFNNGNKFFEIKPHFIATLYTTTLSKDNERKLIKLLEKTVAEDFNFLKNHNLKIEFKEVKVCG